MTDLLLYCLTHIGRGNAKHWRNGADSMGGFTLTDATYWLCRYSPKGIELFARDKSKKVFTPHECDEAVKSKDIKQLTLF